MIEGWVKWFRSRRLRLTLIAFICTTLVIWAWEKTSGVAPEIGVEMLSPKDLNLLGEAPLVEEKGVDQNASSESSIWDARSTVSENRDLVLDDDSGHFRGSARETAKDESVTKKSKQNKQDCDYRKGKWVLDKSKPHYSGFGCRRWLSPMWACRLTQRLDFAYESFKWQPENCELPNFVADSFLRRMANKTIAMVGDSLGRQQFQSLMCMITGGEERSDVEDVGWEYGLIIPRGAIRPDGWAYRFPDTNTTVLFYWSASLCELEPLNQKSKSPTDFAMHLDRPVKFLRQYLHQFDVLILNTGHHWNKGKLQANRWIMYMNGAPIKNNSLIDMAYAKSVTVHSVVKWLDSQLPHHPRLKAFFRTLSPRHFFNGEWNTGGTCDNTVPLSGGSSVLQTMASDPVAESAVRGTRVRPFDITGLSALRDEGHISRYSIKATPGVQDCLHWCLPGIPDAWNEIFATLI